MFDFDDYGAKDDFNSKLESVDRDAAKIDDVINSHLHLDHAGGNGLDHGHPTKRVDGEHDLFGDGSVVTLPTYISAVPCARGGCPDVLRVDLELD